MSARTGSVTATFPVLTAEVHARVNRLLFETADEAVNHQKDDYDAAMEAADEGDVEGADEVLCRNVGRE